ncbi:septum formation initiator family protein [Pleionea sp. CnH1-48]|uniref:FtsB family cell division protein n=1 Tax=Pleionea sp. CnH1-48 TaxID=2954494 RepID=UPI002096DD2E|nr:septum formation initiator family protein [Pleionea sp. CnH1-48]MCO7226378.1 septum formation initiator family protein [Pleionea sp. CnH1-48]
MKWWAILLLILTALLQIRLWSNDGGIAELRQLETKVAEQKQANEMLRRRNADLRKQVDALRSSEAAIEQYARQHLEMIKPGETFYRFTPPRNSR